MNFLQASFQEVTELLYSKAISFFFLASNAFRDIGSVGRIEKKKT